MLILHFIGLAMGLGTSFAHAFLGKTMADLNQRDAVKFRLQLKALNRMGTIGLLLLFVSGSYLLIPYWGVLSTLPLLILKLVLFSILVLLIVFIKQGVKKNSENYEVDNLKRMELMGKLTLIISVIIVILAVSIFH